MSASNGSLEKENLGGYITDNIDYNDDVSRNFYPYYSYTMREIWHASRSGDVKRVEICIREEDQYNRDNKENKENPKYDDEYTIYCTPLM